MLVLCYNRKGEVERQPLKANQARNLKSSTFTRMTQQHQHNSLSQRLTQYSDDSAPTVGAVLAYLRLVHWWHAVLCDVWVVSSLAACIAP